MSSPEPLRHVRRRRGRSPHRTGRLMHTTITSPHHTYCYGCRRDLDLDPVEATVTVHVESTGSRGKGFVGAHTLTGDIGGSEALWEWTCPRCGYEDSLDVEEAAS